MDHLAPKVGEPKVDVPKFELISAVLHQIELDSLQDDCHRPGAIESSSRHRGDHPSPTPKHFRIQRDGDRKTAHYHSEGT